MHGVRTRRTRSCSRVLDCCVASCICRAHGFVGECAGYSVEGTLAHQLLSSPRVVEARDGRKLSLNASIEHVTFAGGKFILGVPTFFFPIVCLDLPSSRGYCGNLHVH